MFRVPWRSSTYPAGNSVIGVTSNTALIAANTTWPALVVGIAIVVAVCLWGMFRAGSIADRARSDEDPRLGEDAQNESGTD